MDCNICNNKNLNDYTTVTIQFFKDKKPESEPIIKCVCQTCFIRSSTK